MIEINLIQKKKTKSVTTVAGIDLSKLNLKMIAVSLALYFAQDGYLPGYFSEIESDIQAKINVLTAENGKLSKGLEKHKNIKEKINLYERRRKELIKRSSYVDTILKTRTNPKKILERLARSVPDNMWFENLKIDQTRQIVIKGRAEAYKSIGDFLTMANESAFFGGSLTLSSKGSATKDEVLYGKKKRIEVYEIKGKVETFDPWQQKK